jgi:hypothetical protein
VPGFVTVEADGIDEPLDLLHGQRPDRSGRPRHLEQPRGRGRRRSVLRPRGQQRADQHLKRIFLARFGNFLDRWKFEAVNLAREGAHDGTDMAGGPGRPGPDRTATRAQWPSDWQ